MPSSVFSSFYNDSSDDIGQLSPSFLPNSNNNNQSSKKADDSVAPNEVRRPSVASATTVSSSGSKSSVGRGFHKKLQGFFGEEFPGESISRQNSEIGIPNPSVGGGTDGSSSRFRGRNNSINNTIGSSIGSRPVSPASSRPRTPQPSSEVTPWEYQDFKVSLHICCNRSPSAQLFTASLFGTGLLLLVIVSTRAFPYPVANEEATGAGLTFAVGYACSP